MLAGASSGVGRGGGGVGAAGRACARERRRREGLTAVFSSCSCWRVSSASCFIRSTCTKHRECAWLYACASMRVRVRARAHARVTSSRDKTSFLDACISISALAFAASSACAFIAVTIRSASSRRRRNSSCTQSAAFGLDRQRPVAWHYNRIDARTKSLGQAVAAVGTTTEAALCCAVLCCAVLCLLRSDHPVRVLAHFLKLVLLLFRQVPVGSSAAALSAR